MSRIRRHNGRTPHAALKAYKNAHWGIEADKVLEVDDRDLPSELTMMGRLAELEVAPPGGRGRTVVLKFDTEGDIPPAMLLFDLPRTRRLYNVLDPENLRNMKRRLWDAGKGIKAIPLSQLARWDEDGHPYPQRTRLRQHAKKYPRVMVKPVGIVTRVVYETPKMDDAKPRRRNARRADDFDPDFYEHHMGEESGHQPWLGVDAKGRLWWAGGNYHVPDAGITD